MPSNSSMVLTLNFLETHYVEQCKSISVIAKEVGCLRVTVSKKLKEFGIPLNRTPLRAKQANAILTKQFLEENYCDLRKTIRTIAIETGFSDDTVSRKLKVFDIKRRSSEGQPKKDMRGKTFGRLAVIELSHVCLDKRAWWKCKCRCGKEVVVCGKELRIAGNKRTISCGHCPSKVSSNGIVPQSFLTHIRHGAESRGLAINVVLDDLEELFLAQDGKCALSGVPLVLSHIKNNSTASLDRKDSSKGYEKDNIQFVHKFVNIMKWDFKQETFIRFCAAITKNTKGSIDELSKSELAYVRHRRKRISRASPL